MVWGWLGPGQCMFCCFVLISLGSITTVRLTSRWWGKKIVLLGEGREWEFIVLVRLYVVGFEGSALHPYRVYWRVRKMYIFWFLELILAVFRLQSRYHDCRGNQGTPHRIIRILTASFPDRNAFPGDGRKGLRITREKVPSESPGISSEI